MMLMHDQPRVSGEGIPRPPHTLALVLVEVEVADLDAGGRECSRDGLQQDKRARA